MGEKTNDFGESVGLENVEKLERFLESARSSTRAVAHHFKAKTTVNHQQDQIHDLSQINHAIQIVSAFHKSDSPRLARYHRDGTLRLVQRVFCETPDERS